MTRFTDSPFEYMMQRRPKGGKPPRPPALALPKGHRCYGCSSYGRACYGLCHRELIITKQSKEGGTPL